MRPPTVIATDLDGTLLDDDRALSDRTRKALAEARERGFAVVAVTARTPYGIDVLPELHPLVDAAVCAGGAIVYEPITGRMRILDAIEPSLARRAAAAIAAALPDAAFAVETGTGIVGQPAFEELAASAHWEFADSVEAVLSRASTVVKLKVYDPGRTGESMAELVAGLDLGGLDMCHWGDFGMLDYNAPGCNKASGLAAWCAERGLGAGSVVAFGDMPNDAPMLAWAGRSYAVDGAHPEALAAAGGVTASNNDDGVAQVIEALLDHSGPLRGE